MDTGRIQELLEPFLSSSEIPCHSGSRPRPGEARPERSRREAATLSVTQLHYISTYIDILLRWNARVNLTAIRNEEEIVTRHFGESIFAARYLFPNPVAEDAPSAGLERSAIRLADVGSGAGFPGLPIKLWAPDISLTLIESNGKKVAFLREVARALTLMNINIQNTRAEDLTETFDVVTIRAVERLVTILPTAARLMAPDSRLALLVSSSQQEQMRGALAHLAWEDPVAIPESASRLLLVGHIGPR
jgi:16S rRNA (guanine527-N7)-methyltransferase